MSKESELRKSVRKAWAMVREWKPLYRYADARLRHWRKVKRRAQDANEPRAIGRANRKIDYWRGLKKHRAKWLWLWINAARRRRKKYRALKRKQATSKDKALGSWDGRQVAGWMVGVNTGPDGTRTNWLQKSVNAGWSGKLYSGWRDPAYSESLCYGICGAPSCPGLCAGRSSNHSQTGPPNWGAIDVQDYYTFGAAQRQIGSPLKNNLPNDRPHYSYTGY